MIIEGNHLVKAYNKRNVVNDVSITFSTGEVVGLLGPNGAGKTTTFYMLTGLVKPNGGNVTLDGKDITKMPMYKRARKGIGYLAQERSVFRRLSVADNIRLVMEQNGKTKAEINAKITELSDDLHLTAFLHKPGGVLSGGECRRAEIARALSTEPHFILLDEPFTGIDPVTIEELQGIIKRLSQQGIGILITDHNVDATLSITDRNYVLIDGQIAVEGDAEAIRTNETVRKFYLGRGFLDVPPPSPEESD